MDGSSPYFRPWMTACANGNCGKSSEKTDKRMKVKYLKIRFKSPHLPLVHPVERNQVPRTDCSRQLLKQHES
jgi:hypothetical protein